MITRGLESGKAGDCPCIVPLTALMAAVTLVRAAIGES
jgi:hypothetical protein